MMDELEEHDGRPAKFMKEMYQSSKEAMMVMIYNSIVNEEMGALEHDAPMENKIEGVYSVIDFFKDREEYEKCAELQKIINKLEDANNKG